MKPRTRIFALLGLLAVGALTYYLVTGDHSSDLVLMGTVDANTVVVSPVITGRVVQLAVQEGQAVKAGDLVAVLDNAELASARNAASATALSTQGDTAGAVANAQATLRAAEAALIEATANRTSQAALTRRTVALAGTGVASAQDRDAAVEALKAAQARERAARDQIAAAQAALRAAEARTHQVSAAQAQTAQAEARLGYTRIYAPVSGTVTLLAAREGEVVNPGGAIATITDLSQTWVYAGIPETQADAIQVGDALPVRMPSGARLEGRVLVKYTEGDFATQRDVSRIKRDIKTVRLKLLIPNTGERFVPGMTAEVLVPR
ncbi:MAG: efflux RND transporter periplasmic adaptor subunit, partial [Acidobacteriota bacterium]|nr:efflux RND transporter periplasmic adaptor subunit [Acidobacteriota bacterium]